MKRLNVYIVHASHLIDRRRVIDELRKTLAKYTFSNIKVGDITVIDKFDPSNLKAEDVQPKVNYTPLPADAPEPQLYNGFIRVLHINNVSNALKHHEALRMISEVKTGEQELHLVLEDDLLYEPKVCLLLDRLVEQIANGHEIVFLGFPNNEPINPSSNQISLKETKNVFRILPFIDSYFVTPATAGKLIADFFPIKFYTNIQMDYLIRKHGIRSQQCVPNIFVDGTKYGMFLSTQVLNNELIFNRDYMIMKELCDKAVLSAEEKETVQQLTTKSQLAEHPDFMFLVGKHHKCMKNAKKAQEIYQKVYDGYKRNGIHINNESLFLREYINLHSLLQEDI
jgi:hypothetical protein